MLIADVGLAELLWTTLWLFFLFMFIWIFVILISDIFRDHELSGWAKALWILLLIIFPLIGSLIYIIVRGPGMAKRAARRPARPRPSSTPISVRRRPRAAVVAPDRRTTSAGWPRCATTARSPKRSSRR